MPLKWAKAMMTLGNALRARGNGDQDDDVREAITVFKEALAQISMKEIPMEWGSLQLNLANAYEIIARGGRDSNMANAVASYEAALEVFTVSAWPAECLLTARRLGELHSETGQWEKALYAYRIALAAGQQLYSSSTLPTARESELSEIGGLYHMAAFAAARAGDHVGAIVILEQGRAQALAEALALEPLGLGDLSEANREALENLRRALQRVRELENAELLVDSMMSGELIDHLLEEEGLDPEQQVRARRLTRRALYLDINRARAAVIEARDRLLQGGYGDLAAIRTVDWDTIGAAVEESTPLAYLATTSQGTMILLAYRSGGQPHAEAIWADGFRQLQLASLLLPGEEDPPVSGLLTAILEQPMLLRDTLDALLPVVAREIVEPLAARLAALGAAKAVLIPCGALQFVPFHAAMHGDEAGTRCLDMVEITYSPSARVLLAARKILATESMSDLTLVAVGDPRPHSHRGLCKTPVIASERVAVRNCPESWRHAASGNRQRLLRTIERRFPM